MSAPRPHDSGDIPSLLPSRSVTLGKLLYLQCLSFLFGKMGIIMASSPQGFYKVELLCVKYLEPCLEHSRCSVSGGAITMKEPAWHLLPARLNAKKAIDRCGCANVPPGQCAPGWEQCGQGGGHTAKVHAASGKPFSCWEPSPGSCGGSGGWEGWGRQA